MKKNLQALNAEQIAHALPGCRRIRADQYIARCPSHDDNDPSLAITQKGDRVLLICRAGCSQREVIQALQREGLWPEKKKRTAKVHSLIDKQEMRALIAAVEFNLKSEIPNTTKHLHLYHQYQRVLCSPFSPGEVVEMDLFCRLYSADVRAGKTPGAEADKKFRAFNRALLDREVPYEY